MENGNGPRSKYKEPTDPTGGKRRLTPLNVKREKFARAVVETGNATEAAILAGHKGTKEYLHVKGSQLMSRPDVRARVMHLLDKGEFLEKGSQMLNKAVEVVLEELDAGVISSNAVKIMEMYREITGLRAPTQIETKNVSFSLPSYPEETKPIPVEIEVIEEAPAAPTPAPVDDSDGEDQ